MEGPLPISVLLIDDEEFEGTLLRRRLENEGISHIDLRQATSAEKGIAEIERSEPQVVLLDNSIPPTTFPENLGLIRSNGYRGPVVLYTQLDREAVTAKGLLTGADAYLYKGDATPERIVELVEGLTG